MQKLKWLLSNATGCPDCSKNLCMGVFKTLNSSVESGLLSDHCRHTSFTPEALIGIILRQIDHLGLWSLWTRSLELVPKSKFCLVLIPLNASIAVQTHFAGLLYPTSKMKIDLNANTRENITLSSACLWDITAAWQMLIINILRRVLLYTVQLHNK